MIVQNKAFDREYEEILEKIAILKGVQQYPSRVKCATLAWHALDLMIKKHEANHGSAI
jgi:NifU-like protein involved in Fe-S cluster formation